MRLTAIFSAFAAVALVHASQRTAHVYLQAIEGSDEQPDYLAEIAFDPTNPASSSVVAYEAPDIPETARTVRIGLFDPVSSKWISGTTVASVDNFGKGLSPNIILSVDVKGQVLSAACKGVRIDAGQTRDFGPQAVVLLENKGKQPELNKPIVLSPEGKKAPEEPEKTFLQKYWWMLAIGVFIAMSGGGGGGEK